MSSKQWLILVIVFSLSNLLAAVTVAALPFTP